MRSTIRVVAPCRRRCTPRHKARYWMILLMLAPSRLRSPFPFTLCHRVAPPGAGDRVGPLRAVLQVLPHCLAAGIPYCFAVQPGAGETLSPTLSSRVPASLHRRTSFPPRSPGRLCDWPTRAGGKHLEAQEARYLSDQTVDIIRAERRRKRRRQGNE